ncbi:MAG TPA: hypothetical protein VGN75_17860, partial [Kaistia sp.]|nr:hypothetical protein [Kaistia sp.]
AAAGCAATDGGAGAAMATSTPAATAAPSMPPGMPPAGLSDFTGPWAGHTEKDTSTKRAATLLIEQRPDGGFSITWASFEAGDIAGSVLQRERRMTFAPTAEPGIWTAEDTSSDPFAHLGAWARIDGRTLRIDVLGLRRDGKLERQVYERALESDDMMLLTYRRFVEDELTKTIGANFMRL